MTTYGILPTGFVPATAPEIRDEIEESFRTNFGRSLPLGDKTVLGHSMGIVSERLALLWEVAEASYAAMDPDRATGDPLRQLGLLTGTLELSPASSTVDEVLGGADASVVPIGTIIAQSSGKQFETMQTVTIVALTDWAALTAYVVGDRARNNGNCYQCTVAGTSDVSGGPTTTDDAIVDATVTWTYIGTGEGVADVVCASVDTGEIVAVARDLTDIITPVSGLETAINLEDAALGRGVQTDESFRLMREGDVNQPGTGPADAIRSAILNVSGVTSCTVFYNNTDVTDGDGLTPHSCEVLVRGGDDQDIWDALWDNVPVGIATIGDETGTALDDEGNSHTMNFSRPDELLIHVKVTLTKNVRTYVGDAAVKLAIAEWGALRGTGYDVVASAVSAASFVTGVLDVTEVLVSVDPIDPPVSSVTIPVALRELAIYATTRVTVVSSNGTP